MTKVAPLLLYSMRGENMNKVQMYISLDVCRPGLQETVYVTGGDQASRELCISLNVGGVPLDMQSGEVTAAY